MENKIIVYLALGSNIDDRMAFLAAAESMLAAHPKIEILRSSKVYETEPWPRDELPDDHPHAEKGQLWFLNQVLQIETSLSPQDLVNTVLEIEKEVGRVTRSHWGAREIDIDILLYGDQTIDTQELEIPHRHMEDRLFVLIPLVEIAPGLTDPMTGRRFKDILEEVQEKDDHKVTPFL